MHNVQRGSATQKASRVGLTEISLLYGLLTLKTYREGSQERRSKAFKQRTRAFVTNDFDKGIAETAVGSGGSCLDSGFNNVRGLQQIRMIREADKNGQSQYSTSLHPPCLKDISKYNSVNRLIYTACKQDSSNRQRFIVLFEQSINVFVADEIRRRARNVSGKLLHRCYITKNV
jgi:hypothetical protein